METIIYSKFSNERSDEFKIRTDILINSLGNKIVMKSPLTKEAYRHIDNIFLYYNLLSEMYNNSKIEINKCNKIQNVLEFEYVIGKTLEEELDELLLKEEYGMFVDRIKYFKNVLEEPIGDKYFKSTDKFNEIFGEIKTHKTLKAADINNIDFIFSNVIVGDNFSIIDYEWTFDFPIPFNYIIYRAIHHYINGTQNRNKALDLGLFNILNISEEEISIYEIMETRFQNYVLGDIKPINSLQIDNIEKNIDVKSLANWLNIESYIKSIQIFLDYGHGFNENDSYRISVPITENIKIIEFDIPIKQDVKKVRIDPANSMCIVKVNSIIGEKDDFYKMEFTTNGKRMGDNTIAYCTLDPQITLHNIEYGTKNINVKLYVQPVSNEIAIHLCEYTKLFENTINNLNNELEQYKIEKIRYNDKIQKYQNKYIELEEEYNKKIENYNNLYLEEKMKLDTLEKNYYSLINSNSWKLTGPIRYALDRFKLINYKLTRRLSLLKKTRDTLKRHGLKITLFKMKAYLTKDNVNVDFSKITNNTPYDISFDSMLKYCESIESNVLIYNKDTILNRNSENSDNNVLLISHTLDLTGAPVAIRFFAKKLSAEGYNPIIVSPTSGALVDTLVNENLPIIIYDQLLNDDFIPIYSSLFSFVVANTIVCSPIVKKLSGLDIPVIWWIHEAEVSYHKAQKDMMPDSISENIKVYCGGSYAKNILEKNFPNYKSDILLYYVPDYYSEMRDSNLLDLGVIQNKIVFASIGTLEERKGQDILVDAITSLDDEYIKNSYFLFVGKECYEPIYKKIKTLCNQYPQNVKYISEIQPDDLKKLYKQMDCLICSSKDDPMPIVVTEAFLMKKVVICSENVGSAQFIKDEINGLLYKNNDYIELAKKIEYVVDNRHNLNEIGNEAREIYNNNFSKEAFNNQINNIIKKFDMDSKCLYDVSIVIPTYNAGNQFNTMINLLKAQKNCGQIEIIVVDSGSNDSTIEIAKKNNIKLVEIPNESFSHSYSRNLGAEMASGNILVFMTQDAMPSSENWLSNLVHPILAENISAVSCSESCPDETDLYYKICSYGHAKYVGFYDKDLVGTIENCTDLDSLRKNASLNDVSCAVKRNVFLKYRYRHDYAEDLDLGIRLIKDGYKIKILSGIYVIHGHNRNSDYYMKRAIVEYKSFLKIFDIENKFEDENLVSSRIIYSYDILLNSIEKMERNAFEFSNTNEFIKQLSKILESEIKNLKKSFNFDFETKESRSELEKLVIFLKNHSNLVFHESVVNIAIGTRMFLDNILNYLELYPIEYNSQIKLTIYDCMIKNFSSSVGSEVCKFNKDDEIVSYIEKLSKGV